MQAFNLSTPVAGAEFGTFFRELTGCQDIIGSNPSVFLDKRFTKIEKATVFTKPFRIDQEQGLSAKNSTTTDVRDRLWYTCDFVRDKALRLWFV